MQQLAVDNDPQLFLFPSKLTHTVYASESATMMSKVVKRRNGSVRYSRTQELTIAMDSALLALQFHAQIIKLAPAASSIVLHFRDLKSSFGF